MPELLARFWAEVLGWQVVNHGSYGADEFQHLSVHPGRELPRASRLPQMTPCIRPQAGRPVSRICLRASRFAATADLTW